MKKSILVIASHPDDETIGCGGSLLRHISEGDSVNVLTLTNGVGSRESNKLSDVKKRQLAAVQAFKILGINWIASGDFPDNNMDSIPLLEIIKFIENNKNKFPPDIVYTHSPSDLNIDHRICASAAVTSFRPQPEEKCSEIRFFEVASSTDFSVKQLNETFNPNLFVCIDKFIEKKLEALKCYEDEIKNFPHSRSIEKIKSLAEYRGGQSGQSYAEAFEVVRKIER